jgi:hypothetical protein
MKTVPLSPELQSARNEARTAFKALPKTAERDGLLNALGRIGKPALRHKIRARVKLISDCVDRQFPELALVTDQAVDCRNFYVHGTPGAFDFGSHPDQRIFFTDTLEFVFAASDLIDSGWRIADWTSQWTTGSHPFSQYRIGYTTRLAELKKLIQHGAACAKDCSTMRASPKPV